MPSITEIQNRIVSLESELSAIVENREMSPEDADRAHVLEGRISEARDNLVSEAARVQAENERIRVEAAANSADIIHDLAELVLGPRDSFSGLDEGWRVKIPEAQMRLAQYAARNAVSGLSTPQIYSTDLPEPIAAPMGFLDTLPKGKQDGDLHYFQAPTLTNAAAGWTTGNKAESSIEWTAAVANLEVIAHHMPIQKQTARRYRSLETIVGNALMLGLAMKKDAFAVSGSNSNGIVGAMNQTGVQTYTKQTTGAMADTNIYDMAVEMRRLVRVNSGFAPDCVALPSTLVTQLKKAKGSDGHYLYPEIVKDGKLDGLTIVEDENVFISTTTGTGDEAVTTTTNYMMVYFSGACSWNTADEDSLEIGLTSNQFIQNAYTLLAEGTYALAVPFPKAFCLGAW